MARRFRRVNSEGKRSQFRIFLIHGRSREWKKVKQFIEKELRFKVIVSIEKFTGEPLIQKIRKQIWQNCDCAVAILSADDKKQAARPNVLFEVGYCMGFFDFRYWADDNIQPVILISDKRTRLPSDLEGVELIPYSRRQGITETFGTVRKALNGIHAKVDAYFE